MSNSINQEQLRVLTLKGSSLKRKELGTHTSSFKSITIFFLAFDFHLVTTIQHLQVLNLNCVLNVHC